MELQISIDRSNTTPLQIQIFDQIRDMVLDGRLRPGSPLPSTRNLSQHLEVSRNTVLIAYERLATEGYVRARASSRTYVNEVIPDAALFAEKQNTATDCHTHASGNRVSVVFSGRAPRLNSNLAKRPPIDFWVGCPHTNAFPKKAFQRLLLRNLMMAGTNLTEYGDPAGKRLLRDAIAEHLGAARGIQATPDQIVMVQGAQEALNIISRLFIENGTLVAVEDPCYQGAAFAFESFGGKILPISVDDFGLVVDNLPPNNVSLVYVTPSHQFPTGWTMSQERRLKLLAWAQTSGSYIIEDDYDSDFRYDGPPLRALYGLDETDNVIYVGTFSKSLGAGLRTGYMVLPQHLHKYAIQVKALTSNSQPWLEQAFLTDFLRTGAFTRHLRVIRQRYLAARDSLIDSLGRNFGDIELTGQDGGMHLMWHLDDRFPDASDLQALARTVGVGLYGIQGAGAVAWNANRVRDKALAIGYAPLSPSMIREGIDRIARLLN